MIKNEKHLLTLCFVVSFIVLLTITLLHLISEISDILFKSILLGAGLSVLNFAFGYLLIKFSVNKSEKIFLLTLWGGLLLRLILGLSIVLIAFIFLEINAYGFIFSILFFYVFYLLIEIFYLNLGRKSHFGDKQQY
jgi:hypothetical protein